MKKINSKQEITQAEFRQEIAKTSTSSIYRDMLLSIFDDIDSLNIMSNYQNETIVDMLMREQLDYFYDDGEEVFDEIFGIAQRNFSYIVAQIIVGHLMNLERDETYNFDIEKINELLSKIDYQNATPQEFYNLVTWGDTKADYVVA